jgi:uncharacterized protein YecT (DUF1311 family)
MKQIVPALLLCAALSLTGILPIPARAQSQAEMNQQAVKDFDAADAAMNKAYKQLMSKVDKEAQAKLRSAQRAWVAFRDAQADFEADLEARGGSMAPMSTTGAERSSPRNGRRNFKTWSKTTGLRCAGSKWGRTF